MTEKVRLLRPSAFAERAELFYSDITGKTLGLSVDKDYLKESFSIQVGKDFWGEIKAGFTFSESKGFYIAECVVQGDEDFLDFRKKLLKKQAKIEELGIKISVNSRIPIRIIEKSQDGFSTPKGLSNEAPITNSKIFAFLKNLCSECKSKGIDIDYFLADEDGLVILSVKGSFCEVADKIIFIKVIAKRLSEKFDLTITFMPKPFFDKKGGGLDVIVKVEGEKRKNFFEGVLLHSPESVCMIASTVNSFARIKERSGYICHGKGTDVLFRSWEGEDTLIFEYDFGDILGNTYISFCSIIESGIMGIEQNLVLRDSVDEITPAVQKETGRIPFSLEEAIEISWSSGFMKGTLGESSARAYYTEKKKESVSFDKTSGEKEQRYKYFDFF